MLRSCIRYLSKIEIFYVMDLKEKYIHNTLLFICVLCLYLYKENKKRKQYLF